ncbi:TPA: hypothetical protein ACH3X3_001071 [Trebouxia sp. C0006]
MLSQPSLPPLSRAQQALVGVGLVAYGGLFAATVTATVWWVQLLSRCCLFQQSPAQGFPLFLVVIRCLITSWLSAANSQARANILALRALSPQLMALPWPLVLACTSLHHHLAAPATPESHH